MFLLQWVKQDWNANALVVVNTVNIWKYIHKYDVYNGAERFSNLCYVFTVHDHVCECFWHWMTTKLMSWPDPMSVGAGFSTKIEEKTCRPREKRSDPMYSTNSLLSQHADWVPAI